jgi:hypothetical protein
MIDPGLVKFRDQNSNGLLRSLLETGSIATILNIRLDQGKILDQVIRDQE